MSFMMSIDENSTNTINFDSLPSDLVLSILQYTKLSDQLSMACTNRHQRYIANSDAAWYLRIKSEQQLALARLPGESTKEWFLRRHESTMGPFNALMRAKPRLAIIFNALPELSVYQLLHPSSSVISLVERRPDLKQRLRSKQYEMKQILQVNSTVHMFSLLLIAAFITTVLDYVNPQFFSAISPNASASLASTDNFIFIMIVHLLSFCASQLSHLRDSPPSLETASCGWYLINRLMHAIKHSAQMYVGLYAFSAFAEAARWALRVLLVIGAVNQIVRGPQGRIARLLYIVWCLVLIVISILFDPFHIIISFMGPILKSIFLSNVELEGSEWSQNLLSLAVIGCIYCQPVLDLAEVVGKRASHAIGCFVVFTSTLYSLVMAGLCLTQGATQMTICAVGGELSITLIDIGRLALTSKMSVSSSPVNERPRVPR